MRVHGRLLLGMFGLAIAVPSVAVAAPFGDDAASMPVAGQPEAQAQREPHHHQGLFGRRHCVECQRAYVKAHDGIDIPAPPPVEPGAMVHNHAMAAPGSSCAACQGNAVVTGPVVDGRRACARLRRGWRSRGDGQRRRPGLCGRERDRPSARIRPRSASRARPRQGMAIRAWRRWALVRRGSYDPSVMPTSIPPAQVAIPGPRTIAPISSATCSDFRIRAIRRDRGGQRAREACGHRLWRPRLQGDRAAGLDGLW